MYPASFLYSFLDPFTAFLIVDSTSLRRSASLAFPGLGGPISAGRRAENHQGGFALIGRAKEIISRGGMKIAPLEVEAAITSHPLVHEALCGSIAHETLGEAVHLLVALKSGAHVTANELRLWAADRIEHYKLPNAIHIVDGLPLGKTGKADRRAVGAVVASLAKSSSS